MFRRKGLIWCIVLILVLCALMFTSCGKAEPEKDDKGGKTEVTEPENKDLEEDKQNESGAQNDSEPEKDDKGGKTNVTQPENQSDELIKRVQGASDETGIYSFIVTLSSKAADKGTLEYIYYGPKGSAQEGTVICDYLAYYSKESSGTFDIRTYYDGKVDKHLTNKTEVKVDNTFSATVRGGSVIVYYTPDGGEKQEIYRADSAQFLPADKK